jgi:hypothetical protein
LYDTAISFGATEDQARDYANQLIATPDDVQTRVNLEGAAAAEAALNNVSRDRVASITVRTSRVENVRDGNTRAMAEGGAVYGPGPIGKDSVHAILAPGEHVLTATDVARLGGQAGVYALRNQLQSGVRRYAEGGAVQYAPSAPMVMPAGGGDVKVMVSSKGGVDLLKYVDVRVERADKASSQTLRAGSQKRW